MSLKVKSAMIARVAAIAGVVTAAVTFGMAGTANAAYSAPPSWSTGGFGLDMVNNPGNEQFDICNGLSTSARIWVMVEDDSLGGARVEIKDTKDGNVTLGEWVNFNPGGCESWWVVNYPVGDTLEGDISTATTGYGTGPVRYN